MKFTGRLKELIIDYMTGELTILFETYEDFRDAYEKLKGEKLSLEIKKYRQKRSLDANRYYWALVTKLAKVLRASNQEVHNEMLRLYGEPEIFDGKPVYITIPDTEQSEKKVNNSADHHFCPTSQVREGIDGVMYRTYRLLRGSHTYDTEEMARLIDGIISECKDVGIPESEIASPDEKRILEERYDINFG